MPPRVKPAKVKETLTNAEISAASSGGEVSEEHQQAIVERMQEQEYRRSLPSTDLDFQLMVTDPKWGIPDVSPELREHLARLIYTQTPEGKTYVRKSSLWDLMGYYTRDLRLANLDHHEMFYCQYYLDLAGDCLQEDYVRPFIICLSRVASVIELSQSKNGFLRKRSGTITTERLNGPNTEKKGLFGFLSGGNTQNQQQQQQR